MQLLSPNRRVRDFLFVIRTIVRCTVWRKPKSGYVRPGGTNLPSSRGTVARTTRAASTPPKKRTTVTTSRST